MRKSRFWTALPAKMRSTATGCTPRCGHRPAAPPRARNMARSIRLRRLHARRPARRPAHSACVPGRATVQQDVTSVPTRSRAAQKAAWPLSGRRCGRVVGAKRPPDGAASDTFEYRHDEAKETRETHGNGDNRGGTATAGTTDTEDRAGHRVLVCNAWTVCCSGPTVRQCVYRQFSALRPGGGDQRPNLG